MSYRPLPEYGGTDPLPTWRRFTIVLNDIFDALWTAAATMVGKVAGSITTDDDGKALLVGDLSDEELPAEVAVYGTDGEGERGYMLLSDLVTEGNLGTGDVTGPDGVAADGNIAVYDGTTGKLLMEFAEVRSGAGDKRTLKTLTVGKYQKFTNTQAVFAGWAQTIANMLQTMTA